MEFPPCYYLVIVNSRGYFIETEYSYDEYVEGQLMWAMDAARADGALHGFVYVEPQPGWNRGRHLIQSF